MRYLVAGVLVLLAVVAGYLSVGLLANVWADDQDLSTTVWVLSGVSALAVSLGALGAARFVVRKREQSQP